MFSSQSFTLFLILATTAFINAARLKRSPILTDDVAQEHLFPYAVAIISAQIGYCCSGGIIHKRFILSAAHCFVNRTTNDFKTDSFMIYAGSKNYWTSLGETNSKIIFVARIFIPSNYDFANRTSDIAVLELAENLVLDNYYFQKLDLPPEGRDLGVGDPAVTAAFGAYNLELLPSGTEANLTSDGKLRYAIIQILNIDEYRDQIPYDNYEIQDDIHLLGGMLKQTTEKYGMCYGDSGSPLVYIDPNTERKTNTVFGVFIDAFDRWCDGRTLPAIFTKISPFLGFIGNAMSGIVTNDMRVKKMTKKGCNKHPILARLEKMFEKYSLLKP